MALIFLFLSPFLALAKPAFCQCRSAADPSIMTKEWLTNAAHHPTKDALAVLPFRDNVVSYPDPILAAFPAYVAEQSFAQAIAPDIVSGALLSKNYGPLDDPRTAKAIAKALHIRFVAFGSVQKTAAHTARFLINLYDAKTDLTLAPPVAFWAELEAGLPSRLSEGLIEAFAHFKIKTKRITDKTASFEAYRYYVKGRQFADHFDAARLELADAWLAKALREDLENFDAAALSLARVRFMRALLEKNQQKDYRQSWQTAQEALSKVKSSQSSTALLHSAKRFPVFLTAFTSALIAYQNQAYSESARLAAEALSQVPEDGQAQFLYRLASGSARIRTAASARNPVCL